MNGLFGRVNHSALLLAAVGLLSWPLFGLAEDQLPESETEELMDLSLEELLGVEVTSFSRKPQLLSDTPAAMFVVTQDDIARSGARTIPDVLRMVPGIQVAQADASTWAVTSRGSNGIFANKLLVLQDGRSIYSPLYSGVYWDTNDTDLASIDRIEVIRGPGATMWGSNAVNGVINIITKKTQDTQGGKLDAVVGTERTEGTLSYGGQSGDVSYRTFAKYFDRDGFAGSSGSNAPDDWDMLRGGGRVDWEYDDTNTLMFSGEAYTGDIGESIVTPDPFGAPPDFSTTVNEDSEVWGGFMLAAWDHRISETSILKLQTYYDHTEIDNVAPNETRDTFDIDMQHQFLFGDRNDIVWGLGYRTSTDDTTGDTVITLDPDSRTQEIYSAFIQDEISLINDRLFLMIGTKVSRNSFSVNNLEWEPNVRLSWNVTDSHMLWSSISRAVRIPSRVEQDGIINGGVVPFIGIAPPSPTPINGLVTIFGDPDLDTEEVTALELGYRGQLTDTVEADISLFYNTYENLRALDVQDTWLCNPSDTPVPAPVPPPLPPPPAVCPPGSTYITMPILMTNSDEDINSYGAELNMSWRATDALYLQGSYSYLHVDDVPVVPFSAGVDSPEHQVSLRSLWNATESLDFDLWLRYVSELEAQNIDSYVTMDAKATWQLMPQLELSLVGRNLLEDEHGEFIPEFGVQQAEEIPREVYVEALLHF